MERTLQDAVVKVQLIEEAVEAMRNLLAAKTVGRPDDELQRLDLIAKSAVTAVTDPELQSEGPHRALH